MIPSALVRDVTAKPLHLVDLVGTQCPSVVQEQFRNLVSLTIL